MSIETNKQFMRRFTEEVINRKNLAAVDQMVVEDFVEHVPLPGQGPGRAGLKQAIAMLLTAFPDMRWALHRFPGERGLSAKADPLSERL